MLQWRGRELKESKVILVTLQMGKAWGVIIACFEFCFWLQIGESPNPELRIITSVFNQVKYKGEL